jgi:hypothetical protein
MLLLGVVFCGCGLILGSESQTGEVSLASVSRAPATLVPTITPQPTQVVQLPDATVDGLFLLPATSGTSFTMEATADQINEHLAGQVYEQDGMSVKEIWVVLTDEEVIAQGQGAYQPLGLSAGITARGAPVVSEGQVYLQVKGVTLDSSMPAFTRLLVKAAIEQGLKQYSTPLGIEIPVEDADISSVDLQPGKIIITGRTH